MLVSQKQQTFYEGAIYTKYSLRVYLVRAIYSLQHNLLPWTRLTPPARCRT